MTECDHENAVPYAQAFPDSNAKANEGIFYCPDCERELVSQR